MVPIPSLLGGIDTDSLFVWWLFSVSYHVSQKAFLGQYLWNSFNSLEWPFHKSKHMEGIDWNYNSDMPTHLPHGKLASCWLKGKPNMSESA